MRSLFALIITVLITVSAVQAVIAQTLFGDPDQKRLLIYSSLDIDAAKPLIEAYRIMRPEISVEYHDLQSLDAYERVISETDDAGPTADLVLSSAMDLQMKLVNDGYARAVNIAQARDWPSWAQWNDTAFALSFEPSVIIYHKPHFEDETPPETRTALTGWLQAPQNFGQIATYDIGRSGLGFLFLARDAEHHPDIWDLVAKMGQAGVKLYSNSSAILDRVAEGHFALGYNILGSYARVWAANNPDLGIIYPRDYTVVMSRIALVPEAAGNPELGIDFLAFLMSVEGQEILARDAGIAAINPKARVENSAKQMRLYLGDALRPIPVSPGLLVYLDQVKRERLLKRWNSALTQ